MSHILEDLKAAFRGKPKAELQKEWDALEKYDDVGPTIETYFQEVAFFQLTSPLDFRESLGSLSEVEIINQEENPKFFTSDFFN